MPKVVSRSAVSSSTDDCICGEFNLVIDKSLASLPRRKTDGAIVLRSQDSEAGKARVFKLNAVTKDPVLVERQGGHERQYRFHCPRCSLQIGYQSTPPPVKSGPYVYILKGALSQMQGQVPSDAFEDENFIRSYALPKISKHARATWSIFAGAEPEAAFSPQPPHLSDTVELVNTNMDLPSPRELELETLVRERDAHIAELTDEVLHLRQFLSTQTVNPPTDPVSLPPALVSLLLPHIDSRTSNVTPTSTPITDALTQRVKVLQEENNELFELLNTGETGRLKDDVRALRRIVQKLEGALRESHQTIISLSDELEKSQAAMQSYSRPNNLHSHSQSPVPRQAHHRVSHQNSTNGTKKPVPTGPRAHKKPRLSESQTSPPPRANASLPPPPRVNRSQSSSTRRNDSRERSPRVSADRKTPYTKMEVDDDDRKRPRSPEQSRDGGPPQPVPPPMRERERGEREHAKERSSRDHRPRDRERDRDRNRDRGRDGRDRDREHEKERDRERGEREREYDRDHDRSSRRNGGGGGGGVSGGVSRRTRRNSNSNNSFLGGDRTLAERMGL